MCGKCVCVCVCVCVWKVRACVCVWKVCVCVCVGSACVESVCVCVESVDFFNAKQTVHIATSVFDMFDIMRIPT